MASRGGKPTGRAKHRSLKKTVRHKDTQLLNQNGSAIASVIDVLRGQLAQLEKEIVADRAGVKAYQVELQHLDRQKVEAEERLVTNREWAKQFDRDIGPFERKYHTLTLDIHSLYENARVEHGKGIECLMDAFDYHPEFKRFHDKFSAVPFRPKKAESPPKHATSADELANTAKRRKASMAHSKKLQR